ncbi:MAG: metal-dependent transcriptional regulator [Acidobacteria bacterium]|nr:MAG: metal-dependent transcriptional regulator [Acidobacteriota bacterium]REK12200.1 MAG: metal-dependent transcriptional regulator [Acidobacteriota bacterium]
MAKSGSAPTSTVEDYLKCVLVQQQGGADLVSMGQIASRLDVAPGTVTAMMKTLAESGLVEYEPYSGVRLTAAGRRLGMHVLRRHRLIELFLVQVIGLDWSEVHAEAELLEHAVSDRLIERIDEMLDFPSVDPHGDPIPDRSGVLEEDSAHTLASAPTGTALEVARVADQSSDFLREMERMGLVPGAAVRVMERQEVTDALRLEVGEAATSLTLGLRAAAKIFVR